MSPIGGPQLSVSKGVVAEMVRLAVEEVPGVLRIGRGGPSWRAALRGRPVDVRVRGEGADVRVTLIARPGQSLVALSEQVRNAVGSAVERLLGLEATSVVIVVDGVGT